MNPVATAALVVLALAQMVLAWTALQRVFMGPQGLEIDPLLELRDVVITSVNCAPPPVGGGPILMELALNYGRVIFSIREFDEQGNPVLQSLTDRNVVGNAVQRCNVRAPLNFAQGPASLIAAD